jgi:Na+/H+ antiporter NhaD/arsenite permease-like protein
MKTPERVFDWLAALAVQSERGSANRLFALVYTVGMIVTIFLSNDAIALRPRLSCGVAFEQLSAAGSTPML